MSETNPVNPTPSTPAPEVPKVVLTEVEYDGKTYPIETSPAGQKYVSVEDEKLGEVKLLVCIFTEGDKAGLLYFVPEYSDFEQLSKVMEPSDMVDGMNALFKAKLSGKATALYNAKTKADGMVRDAFLQSLELNQNILVGIEDALAYRYGARGESMSGLLKEQKELGKKIAEAVNKQDFNTVALLNGDMLNLMQRIQAFVAKQTQEFASLGELAAQKAGTAAD